MPMVLYRGDADGVPMGVVPGQSLGPVVLTKYPCVDYFGPDVSAQISTSSCLFNPAIPSRCLSTSDGDVLSGSCPSQALSQEECQQDQRTGQLSGLPLSIFKHLEGGWLGQAGCLCSCCTQWGQMCTWRGQITCWYSSLSSTWDK